MAAVVLPPFLLINCRSLVSFNTWINELDDLKSMSVFVQVVDQGSLSAAAEREGISPTMAGNHLRALERKLGAKLLNRTTRRHSLTEVGQTYYDQAHTILQLVAQAHAGVEAAQAKPRGRLRITAPVSFGAERLTPALGEFLVQNGEISIDLTLSDRIGDLIDDGFDAAVRIGELSDSGLIAHQLQPYRMWVCAAPSYLRERGTPARPQELEGHDCLLFSYAGGQWRFGQSDRSPKVRVQGRLQVNNGQAL
jgi:DNA-binding transcriptional LysR family regulator